MAKYVYKDGERRTYRRIDIKFDLQGQYDYAYNRVCHWYIDKYIVESIGLNPPGKTRETRTREYFETIADAKRYIDEF